ncbi:MAG: hypothetical protein IK066_04615 [Kiritimatiellae bacterium]|nr:hypothetical protein [Kiritimatiellia bacterium]
MRPSYWPEEFDIPLNMTEIRKSRRLLAVFRKTVSKDSLIRLKEAFLKFLTNEGEVLTPEALDLAMNYVELREPTLDFRRVVGIAKTQFTGLKPGEGVAVALEEGEGMTRVTLTAITADNEVCLGEDGKPYVVVETQTVAEDLKAAFGDKPLLVLK